MGGGGVSTKDPLKIKLVAEEPRKLKDARAWRNIFTYLRYEGAWCLYSSVGLTKIP